MFGLDRLTSSPILPTSTFRQAFSESRPGVAAIDALPESAARSAADVGVRTPLTLQRRGVDHIRIRRIEDDVGESGVGVDVLDVLPRASAVGGSEQSAISARSPQRTAAATKTICGFVGLTITRPMCSDFLRPMFVHVFAAVLRLVDAIAPRRAALVVRFAVPTQMMSGLLGATAMSPIEADPSMIEYRLPGRSSICGLPHAARCRRNVEEFTQSAAYLGLRPFGNGEVDDASARDRRPDRAPRQLGQSCGVGVEDYRCRFGFRSLGRSSGRKTREQYGREARARCRCSISYRSGRWDNLYPYSSALLRDWRPTVVRYFGDGNVTSTEVAISTRAAKASSIVAERRMVAQTLRRPVLVGRVSSSTRPE